MPSVSRTAQQTQRRALGGLGQGLGLVLPEASQAGTEGLEVASVLADVGRLGDQLLLPPHGQPPFRRFG